MKSKIVLTALSLAVILTITGCQSTDVIGKVASTSFDAVLQKIPDKIKPELGQDKFTYSGEAKPIDSFNQIVKTRRDVIGYHEKLDHYGISLGNGNMFEWAKDMSKNDKDIVFVLNPQPFIDAGVKPEKVEGWAFAKVEVKDMNGKSEEVDKLLKPFDLQ